MKEDVDLECQLFIPLHLAGHEMVLQAEQTCVLQSSTAASIQDDSLCFVAKMLLNIEEFERKNSK